MYENFSFQSPVHFSDMFGAFTEFYNSHAMTDVMVSVSGKTFNAHRIVLSAGSDYFRSILSEFMGSVHAPVLVINDISPENIESMIEFLYRGQIVVTRDRVENLRRAASHLCIKGVENFLQKHFSDNRNASSGHMSSETNRMNGLNKSSTTMSHEYSQQQVCDNQLNKRSLNGSDSERKRKQNSKQVLQMQQQLQHIFQQQQIQAVLVSSKQSRISTNAIHFAEQLCQQQQTFQFQSPSGRFQCEICTKSFFDEDQLQMHLRTHNVTKFSIGEICGKKYASKRSLYKHKRQEHNNGGKKMNPVYENDVLTAPGGGSSSGYQSMFSLTEVISPPLISPELVPLLMMQSLFVNEETAVAVAPGEKASFSSSAPSMPPADSLLAIE